MKLLVKDRFSWDDPSDDATVFEGYHDPSNRWNGFATPAFEKVDADRIAAWQQANPSPDNETIAYDVERDAFVVSNPSYPEDPDLILDGFDAETTDGTKHLYAIGAWAWTWTEVGPASTKGQASVSALALARRLDSVEDVRSFINDCVDALGAGFHPDTPGADYVTSLGALSFTKAEAAAFDVNCEAAALTMDRVGVGDEDVYSLAVARMPVVHYARTAYTVQCGARDSSSLSELTTTTVRAEVTCPACVIDLQS